MFELKSKAIMDPGFRERRTNAPRIWILRYVGAQMSPQGEIQEIQEIQGIRRKSLGIFQEAFEVPRGQISSNKPSINIET